MTSTLTTNLTIPHLGPGAHTVEVDYSYRARHQELVIEGASTKIDGRDFPVWHLLTQSQRRTVEQACYDDHEDRLQAVAERCGEEKADGRED